jgi:hypothetical protein
MLESIPSRNSQLETRPNDERGASTFRSAPDHSDRFPHACKTHQQKSPQSGIPFVLTARHSVDLRAVFGGAAETGAMRLR